MKHLIFGFLLVFGLIGRASFGQLPASSGAVDLTAPVLRFHATLGQINIPSVPGGVIESIDRAQAMATEKGIVSDTLIFEVSELVATLAPADLTVMYQNLVCASDAVVAGHSDTWMHHLNSSGTGIYADYDFVVDMVMKNNGKSSLTATKHIVLTRPGGSLAVGTGTLKIADVRSDRFPHLQAGVEYLMFLSYVPATGGYQAYGPDATFAANGSQWSIVRRAYSEVMLPDFSRGVLENSIAKWLSTCQQ